MVSLPGTNRTTVSYSASAVKIYIAMPSLGAFYKQKYFLLL
jgi:hypothetical protein